jgi:hypothetical protein
MMLISNKHGKIKLRSLLLTMCGIRKTLSRLRRSSMAKGTKLLSMCVSKDVLMKCKNEGEDSSSIFTKKKASSMSSKKVSNNQFRKNPQLLKNSPQSN